MLLVVNRRGFPQRSARTFSSLPAIGSRRISCEAPAAAVLSALLRLQQPGLRHRRLRLLLRHLRLRCLGLRRLGLRQLPRQCVQHRKLRRVEACRATRNTEEVPASQRSTSEQLAV